MKVCSRAKAKIAKHTFYFTNRPCKHGHTTTRRVSNGCCLRCEAIAYKKSYDKHIDKHHNRMNAYYHQNAERLKIYNKNWYLNNPNAVRQYNDQSYKKNKSTYIHNGQKRWLATQQATPMWFEKEEINTLYDKAQQLTETTGIRYHVDHIVPITHKLVCGLNCLANLQILTAKENLQKKNKWIDAETK